HRPHFIRPPRDSRRSRNQPARGRSRMALRTKINPPALLEDSRSLTVPGVFLQRVGWTTDFTDFTDEKKEGTPRFHPSSPGTSAYGGNSAGGSIREIRGQKTRKHERM